MQLLVIRHAVAQEREAFASSGLPDELRPLTTEGVARMRRAVRGLRQLVARLDRLASSPLVRAHETARIVADGYGVSAVELEDAFAPDVALEAALGWAAEMYAAQRSGTVAMVGHEPHLSAFVTLLTGGREEPGVELKKGGICLLRIEEAPRPGSAILRWLLTPRQLRGLA